MSLRTSYRSHVAWGVSSASLMVFVIGWWCREFFDDARADREGALIGAPFIAWTAMGIAAAVIALGSRLSVRDSAVVGLVAAGTGFLVLTAGSGALLRWSGWVLAVGTVWILLVFSVVSRLGIVAMRLLGTRCAMRARPAGSSDPGPRRTVV